MSPQSNSARTFRRISRRRQSAFTLIEVMVVVVIIGILLNIAMPGILRARETSRSRTCVKNLKAIESAKEQYALDFRLPAGAADPGMSVLTGGTGNASYLKSTPACPAKGTYTVGAMGVAPTCSIGDNVANAPFDNHVLPYN